MNTQTYKKRANLTADPFRLTNYYNYEKNYVDE